MSIDSDTLEFNEHDKDLNTKGATTHDLLANLLKAYKTASGRTRSYQVHRSEEKKVRRKKGVSSNQIMVLAANRYMTTKQATRGVERAVVETGADSTETGRAREWNGKEHHECKKHKAWCAHSPSKSVDKRRTFLESTKCCQ